MATAKKAKAPSKGFTKEEREAMKERALEMKAGNSRAEGEKAIMAKIQTMPEPDRTMAKRLHAIITEAAPSLVPRTWYGMPAYSKGDDVLCFFQNANKFKARYSTLGFSDTASLDESEMWPTSFALMKLGPAEEARIKALVKRAVG